MIVGGLFVFLGTATVEISRYFRDRSNWKHRRKSIAKAVLAEIELISQGIDSFVRAIQQQIDIMEETDRITGLSEMTLPVDVYGLSIENLGELDTEDIIKIRKFYVYIAQAKNTFDSGRMIQRNEIAYLRELVDRRIRADSEGKVDIAARLLQTEKGVELKLKEILIDHLREAMTSFVLAKGESKPPK